MDGSPTWMAVLVHEDHALSGAADFVAALKESATPFQVLTSNSIRLVACGSHFIAP